MKRQEVIASGILMGISGIITRMAMINTGEFLTIESFIFNPLIWISSAFGIMSFVYLQISLHKYDISFVNPVVSSIAITTPVILAVIILDEYVSLSRWIGVGLIIIGVLGLSGDDDSKNLYSGFPGKGIKRFFR